MANKESTDAFNPDNCKVRDLRRFLRDHGEFVSGNKAELIQRVKGTLQIGVKPVDKIAENDEEIAIRRRHETFITPLGEDLPDPMSLKNDWTSCVDDIPSINEKDLYNYLVLNTQRTFDHDQMKANRALKAKVFFKDGHVHNLHYHRIKENCSHCFVKCKGMPSISTQNENHKPDYDVWLCMSKMSGQIHSAGCNCNAGEGESCSHIAGMLYGLVDLSEKKKDGLNSSTSIECWWIKPSRKRKLSLKKSQDLTFKKHKFNDTRRETVKKNIMPKNVKPIDVKKFSEKITAVNKHAAWLYANKFSLPTSQHVVQVEDIPKLHDIQYMYRDNVDFSDGINITKFSRYFSSLKVNSEDCTTIERETRGQSNNSDWHKARLGRLTASNFGTICKRKENTPPECLIKTLMRYNVEEYDGPSVRWGRSHERAARRTYEKFQKQKHENFACYESGLYVNKQYPHLGASPDGLVSCKCLPLRNT